MKNKVINQRIEENEIKDKFFTVVKCISVELTRRCNMKCAFCERGDAQNLNISKEVIDKLLDMCEKIDVMSFRLNGGEPLLNKDGLIYLIDEIIRRKINCTQFQLFTNGTIQDKDIKQALIHGGKWCKKCVNSVWGKKVAEITEPIKEDNYDVNAYSVMIVSTSCHDNYDIIDSTIDFYNSDVDPEILHAYNQDASLINRQTETNTIIALRGNALKNFKELYNAGYTKQIFHSNNYNLIDDINMFSDNYIILPKCIGVSANGIIFPGCLEPYIDVDKGIDKICTVWDCENGDGEHSLLYWVAKYSYENPLTHKQIERINEYKTILMFWENGITDFWLCNKPIDEDVINEANAYLEIYKNLEDGLRKIHKLYPNFPHDNLQSLGSLLFLYEITKDEDTRRKFFNEIVDSSCWTDADEIEKDLSDEALEKMLDDYDKLYYTISTNIYGEYSPSEALIEHKTKQVIKNLITPTNFMTGLLVAGLGIALAPAINKDTLQMLSMALDNKNKRY